MEVISYNMEFKTFESLAIRGANQKLLTKIVGPFNDWEVGLYNVWGSGSL